MNLPSLRDWWTIRRLQGYGERLDLKSDLLRPATPLALYMARSVPGFGLWTGRVMTAAVCDQNRKGFIQARWRSGVPAQDVLFIAPSLHHMSGAAWLWQRLVQELVQQGVTQGVQRLFAHLPEEHHGEIEVMRQSGFAIFSQDRIYKINQLPTTPVSKMLWRPREPIDDWGLTRLYNALTPGVVQQAENPLSNGEDGHVGWWGGPRHGGYVLRGQYEGEVWGYLRLIKGEHAHWMKLVLHPELGHRGDDLLQQALTLCRGWNPRPIYTDVRDYEGYILDEIERAGFERLMNRTLLVRHTTAAVRALRPRPALEGIAEVAPTPF